MEKINVGDFISLGFEAKYPYNIVKVNASINEDPKECSIKENKIEMLFKGEKIGEYVAKFEVFFEDGAQRNLTIPISVLPVPKLEKQIKIKKETSNIANLIRSFNSEKEALDFISKAKLEKEEGMTSYIPEEFAGKKEIEQPEKVSHKYKDHEEKQDPIIFEKSDDEPEFYFKSEDIYDFLDEDYFSKMGVKYDPNQILPYGARILGRNIEKDLYHNLRNSIDNWYMSVTEKSALGKAKIDLKSNLLKWQADSSKNVSNNIQKLFEQGINAGIRQSGVSVDEKYYGDINYQLNKPTGIVPALENFQNQTYNKISKILVRNYDEDNQILDVKKAEEEITSFMGDQRYRTELMVKSEVASLSNYGVLKAWEHDPERENYRYYWKAIIDSRSKNISKIRKSYNPMSFNAISFLWKHQKQKIDGKWENDKFFQRCGVARGKYKLDYKWDANPFLGKESDFEETI